LLGVGAKSKQMDTIVKIKWDKPEEQAWLCDANIQIALEQHCKNTKFEVKDLNEMTGSEALFGFCGWLTTRDEKTVMSASDDAACIADLIKKFCDTNKLTEPRSEWDKLLTHPE